MRLDLRDLLDTPGETAERMLDGQIDELEDLELVEPVRGRIRATNSRRLIVVQGHATAIVKLVCSRCLCEFELGLSAEMDATCPVQYLTSLIKDERPEEEADEESAAFFDAISLDVDELVRQSLLLEMPIQPLCRKDCKGICPCCGRNRTLEPCSCAKAADPRFEALSRLLRERNAQNLN
jgi:uncharacterized protein